MPLSSYQSITLTLANPRQQSARTLTGAQGGIPFPVALSARGLAPGLERGLSVRSLQEC